MGVLYSSRLALDGLQVEVLVDAVDLAVRNMEHAAHVIGRGLAAPAGQCLTQHRIPACGYGLICGPGDVPVRAYQHHRERRVCGGRQVDPAGPSAPDGSPCARGCEEHEPAAPHDLVCRLLLEKKKRCPNKLRYTEVQTRTAHPDD